MEGVGFIRVGSIRAKARDLVMAVLDLWDRVQVGHCKGCSEVGEITEVSRGESVCLAITFSIG